MKATIGKTQLTTSSGLTFVHPAYIGTHAQCMQQIKSAGEQTPTYAQIADIAYEALIKDQNNQYSKEIKQIMRNSWLRADTGLLYLPNGKFYFQDRPILGSNGLPIMEEAELEVKLQANDSSVRFVEPGFKKGELTIFELERNPYVIALAGEQGAEQLAEIASTYKDKPFVFSLENVSEPTTRVSAFGDGDWNFDWLYVCGCNRGDGNGRAFGIMPESEGGE